VTTGCPIRLSFPPQLPPLRHGGMNRGWRQVNNRGGYTLEAVQGRFFPGARKEPFKASERQRVRGTTVGIASALRTPRD
jgi:hypothetical protein